MKKILIVCVGGFSSSIFAKKLEQTARRNRLQYKVDAMSPVQGKDVAGEYDLILISPQAAHEVSEFQKIHNNVGEIPKLVYGTVDGPKALELSEELLA